MVWSIYYYDIVRNGMKEAKDWYKRQKPGLEKGNIKHKRNKIQ